MSESALGNFIPAQTADRLIAAHDGDVALLYLYRLRTGETDCERAARDLAAQYQMSVDDVIAAVGADAIRHHIRMTKANQIIVENARNK